MREKLTIVGPCSKYIDGQGWTTEIPVEKLNKAGYLKAKDLLAYIKFNQFPEDGHGWNCVYVHDIISFLASSGVEIEL